MPKKIFEDIIYENFLNMGKETLTQIQEVQRFPYRKKRRKNMPKHILIKLKLKKKKNILKAAGKK